MYYYCDIHFNMFSSWNTLKVQLNKYFVDKLLKTSTSTYLINDTPPWKIDEICPQLHPPPLVMYSEQSLTK